MLFVLDKMKVALMTTHIPLAEVSKAITIEKLKQTFRLLNSELQTKFQIIKVLENSQPELGKTSLQFAKLQH